MTKKVKQKTIEQLHNEIMQLFIGQEMNTTLEILIQTMVGVANFMEVSNAELMYLVTHEMKIYEDMGNAE
jgi:uncharacterized metal-binding protein